MGSGKLRPPLPLETAPWSAGPVSRVAAPLRDRVLEVVRQAILDFELPPGTRLVERKLVEQLDVSRATVREVLARLESEGLVNVIPQKGAVVSALSASDAADLYEMRVSMEALVVRRFVERATPAQVKELRNALTGFEEAVEHNEGTRSELQAKDTFYDVLLTGAESPPLAEMLAALQARVRVLRATSLSVPNRARASVDELTVVVEAIEAGDVKRAAAACAKHIRNAAKIGLARLSEMEESAPTDRK